MKDNERPADNGAKIALNEYEEGKKRRKRKRSIGHKMFVAGLFLFLASIFVAFFHPSLDDVQKNIFVWVDLSALVAGCTLFAVGCWIFDSGREPSYPSDDMGG